ncbi:MAG: hypothetical protein ACE5OY_08020 [Candidatus Bathyarchaeia archaeon]
MKEPKAVRRMVFDAGPFILLFTEEKGSDTARKAVLGHERGENEIFIHPNNLSEAYKVVYEMRGAKPQLLVRDIKPEDVVRSAYATLNVIQDEGTTTNLGMLKARYPRKPWGDLSSAALALRVSDKEKVPVVVLDEERHLDDVEEVSIVRISELEL